jgi:hypothetical protein
MPSALVGVHGKLFEKCVSYRWFEHEISIAFAGSCS